jgi:hypothetical protein
MILAIGDSNLYPACTESEQPVDTDNMIVVFSRQFAESFSCWAKNGASNYWIENHIDYFLADSRWEPNTMLFIGWTSFEREEWPWLYNNISVCGGPDFGMPEPMKARFNEWKTTLTGEYYRKMTQLWHDRIYAMHLKLRERSVPHLFWTTYNNFNTITDHQDWHGNFYKPYDADGCMAKWFESNNILANEGDPFHYGAAAQAAWGTELSLHARKFVL